MNSFRISIIALSVAALMFSAGSSSPASTDYSHPYFTVAEGRTLDVRETGSKLVMETIKDALRAGGLALLGEGFRLDSSLSYVTEESSDGTIKGEIDLALPFYDEGGHVVFTQPGLVFWEGLAEEERVDGNLGIVYRTNLANTPIGIDAVGGASLFYDYDLHRTGHERLGIGLDMQSGNFHGAFNYYYPLSNEENGREGFVEEALKGMDLRVALERETIRAGARVGLWRYDGGEDVVDEWRSSVGFEGGVKIAPGVFIEGEWEKHQEDAILDQRLSLGLAFRFSLPGFEGQGYKDGSMPSDLYRIVEREKRVLYEERVAGPKISIVRTGNEAVIEGGTIALDIELSEALEENVTVNLVGSGSAEYGSSNDYTVSVGGTVCTGVTENNCQVSITTGQTTPSDDVEITINDDGRTNELAETIVLFMVIASTGNTDLESRGSFSLTIPADPPLPSVSLSADNTRIAEGGNATLTVTLSEMLDEDVVINLLEGEGGSADYGTNMDWHLNNGRDCSTATGTSCQITIPASQRSTTATVHVNSDTTFEVREEGFTVSIDIASAGMTAVIEGTPSGLNFTIPMETAPTVSLNYTGSVNVQEGSTVTMTIALSEALEEDVSFNFSLGDDNEADYGISRDFFIRYDSDKGECSSISSCTPTPPTIRAGNASTDISISILPDTAQVHTDTAAERVSLSLGIANAGTTGLILGGTTNQTFTITANTPTTTTPSGTIGFTTNSKTNTHNEPDGRNFAFNLFFDVSDDTALVEALSGDVTLTRTITIMGDENSDISDDITVNPFLIRDDASPTRSVAVDILGDDIVEEAETITITLTDDNDVLPDGWSIDTTNNTATITIPANDNKVSINSSMSGSTVGENGGTANVVVEVNKPASTSITLNVSSADSSTAEASTHFTLSSSTLTIPAGQSSGMITVTGVNNSTTETTARTIVLNLTGNLPAGWVFGPSGPLTHTITITDDDVAPTISISAESLSVEESGMTTITLTLNRVLENEATFNLVATGAPAGLAKYSTAAGWYLTVNGSSCNFANAHPDINTCPVKIPANMRTATATVKVNSFDAHRSSDSNFTVHVEDASGTDAVGPGSTSMLRFTIPADPPLPTVSLSTAGLSIEEGGMATITLTLSETFTRDTTFSLIGETEESTATAMYGTDKDWILNNGTDCASARFSDHCQITIKAGDRTATATVKVNTDMMVEGEETFTISVEVATGRDLVTEGSDNSLDFTIPAQQPTNTIRFASSALTVTEAVGSTSVEHILGVDITLSNPLPAGIKITLEIGGNAEDGDYSINASSRQARDGANYVQASRVYTFPTGTTEARLVFEVSGDTDDQNEMVTLTLTDPNNNLPDGWSIAEPSVVTIAIVDDD